MKYFIRAVQMMIEMLHAEMRQHKGDPSKYHKVLNLLEQVQMTLEEIDAER